MTLRPPDFAVDLDALRAAAAGARMLLLNSPHNPTGRVLTRTELDAIAAVCVEHDLIAVTDEVYEHLVFDGEHIPLATLPGMAERTLTISSAGKSFSFTGWKIGWCSGPPELVAGVRAAKQFLCFAGGTPFQHAVAAALAGAERHVAPLQASLRANRDILCDGLRRAGFGVSVPQGTYFVNADVAPLGVDDAADVVPRAAGARGRRRDPGERVLRRRRSRPHARALRVLQTRGGHRGGRRPAAHGRSERDVKGSASTEIDAPIEAVWAIVQDVESAPAWQRAIDSMDPVERDGEGRPTLADSVTDLKVKPFASRLSFAYDPPTRLSWVQERGDLKALTGSWRLRGARPRSHARDVRPGRRPGRAAVALRQGRARGEAARRADRRPARPSCSRARRSRRRVRAS